ERVGIRQASIRRRVRRVVFDGPLKESDGIRQALRGSLGPQVPPLEVSPIGLGVDLMLGLGILGQSREDLKHNFLCNSQLYPYEGMFCKAPFMPATENNSVVLARQKLICDYNRIPGGFPPAGKDVGGFGLLAFALRAEARVCGG